MILLRPFRLGFSTRLFLLVFILQMASAALLTTVSWQVVQSRLESTSRDLSSELHEELRARYRTGGRSILAQTIENRLAAPAGNDLALLLVDAKGRVLAGNLANWQSVLRPDRRWRSLPLYRTRSDEPELIGLIGSHLDDGLLLLTGHVIEDQRQLLLLVGEVLTLSMALAGALAAAVAAISVRLVNTRVGVLVQTSEAVASGQLGKRVEVKGTRDPFDRLGAGMNVMLDQLERLVTELRLVTDGMAHDLRMPLMRLGTYIENAVLATADVDVHQPLEQAEAEIRHLLRIVGTALEIGRIESGIGRERFEVVQLDELLEGLTELYGPAAEDGGFALRVEAPTPIGVSANRQLLGQAVGNLIENGSKYAGGGILTLMLERDAGYARIIVEDRGTGISEADRTRALRRFGRLDPARQTGGAGLGLALVETIARLHQGELKLEDAAPGLRVIISLPLA